MLYNVSLRIPIFDPSQNRFQNARSILPQFFKREKRGLLSNLDDLVRDSFEKRKSTVLENGGGKGAYAGCPAISGNNFVVNCVTGCRPRVFSRCAVSSMPFHNPLSCFPTAYPDRIFLANGRGVAMQKLSGFDRCHAARLVSHCSTEIFHPVGGTIGRERLLCVYM